MRAVVIQTDKTVKVEERPKPEPSTTQVQVQVKAIGQNPSDWQILDFTDPGNVCGQDCVGIVTQLGSPDLGFKIGDRIGALGYHTLAEYAVTEAGYAFRLPSTLSFEEAATIPIPLLTAVMFVYDRLHLPQPSLNRAPLPPSDQWLLVWAASTAVGQYAIQLAKLSGWKVIGAASESNWDLLKGYGADRLVDYKDKDVVQKIKDITNDSVEHGIDCVGLEQSNRLISESLSSTKGGSFVAVEALIKGAVTRSDVTAMQALLSTAFAGKAEYFGDEVFEAGPTDVQTYQDWLKIIPVFFEKGLLRPLSVLPGGGLDDVQKGFELHKAGKVRAQKLVYSV